MNAKAKRQLRQLFNSTKIIENYPKIIKKKI